MNKRIIMIFTALILSSQSLSALEVPYLTGRINDYAGILSDSEIANLETKLAAFEKETTCQIAVLAIKSLEGENLEQFSFKVAETWKLGQKKKDNGILLLISVNDRKMRIEVGYGLEGSMTDLKSGRIITNEIAPYFKNGDYNGGIDGGITSIINTINTGEYSQSGITIIDDAAGDSSDNDIDTQVNNIPLTTRIFIGIFIFSVLGIFTFIGIFSKGSAGIFLYFFLIPFWAIFPIMAVGVKINFIIFGIYILGVPTVKLFLSKTGRGKKLFKKFSLEFSSSGSGGSGSYSSRSSGSSSSSSFSGGGGSFGGGGSSGSW